MEGPSPQDILSMGAACVYSINYGSFFSCHLIQSTLRNVRVLGGLCQPLPTTPTPFLLFPIRKMESHNLKLVQRFCVQYTGGGGESETREKVLSWFLRALSHCQEKGTKIAATITNSSPAGPIANKQWPVGNIGSLEGFFSNS